MRPPPINRPRPMEAADRGLGVAMLCGAGAAVLLLFLLIHGCSAPPTRVAPIVSPETRALAESFVVAPPTDPPLPKHNLAEPLSLYYLCTNYKSTAIRVMNTIEGGKQVVYVRVLTRTPDGYGWTDAAFGYTLVCRDFREGIGSHFEHMDPLPGRPAKSDMTLVGISPDAKEVQIEFDDIPGFVYEFTLKGNHLE